MVNTGYISMFPQPKIGTACGFPNRSPAQVTNPAAPNPEANEAARIQAIIEIAPAINDDEIVAKAIGDRTISAEDLAYQKLLGMSEKERVELCGKRDMAEYQKLNHQGL